MLGQLNFVLWEVVAKLSWSQVLCFTVYHKISSLKDL